MGFFDNAFFPDVVNDDLEVAAFLHACECLPRFFDVMSAALKPVKADIEGNIRKIRQSFERNPERLRTIRSLLEDEIKTNMHKKDASACVGLLWLKRGLDYVMMLLLLLIDSHRKNVTIESCHAEFRGAYEYALQRHHNWLSQKVFHVATFAFPKRRHLIRCLAHGNESVPDAEVMQRTDEYVRSLRPVIEYLNRLYVELTLEPAESQYPKDFVPPGIDGAKDAPLPTEPDMNERQLGKLLDEAASAAKSADTRKSSDN